MSQEYECPHCRTMASEATTRCDWCGRDIRPKIRQAESSGPEDALEKRATAIFLVVSALFIVMVVAGLILMAPLMLG